jgi:hypothetical protein
MDAHRWQHVFYVYGLALSFVFHAPLAINALALFVLVCVSVAVSGLDGHDRTSEVFEMYFLWNALSLVCGSLVGWFLCRVISSPPFITLRGFIRSPARFWRIALLLAVYGACATCWLLVDLQPLQWLLPTLVCALLIALSYAWFRYDKLWHVSLAVSFVVHFYWLVMQLGAMLVFGVVESVRASDKLPDTVHWLVRYTPVVVFAVFGVQLAIVMALNIYLPDPVKLNVPHILEHFGHVLNAIGMAENDEDLVPPELQTPTEPLMSDDSGD